MVRQDRGAICSNGKSGGGAVSWRMLFNTSTQDDILQRIQAGRGVATVAELQELLDACRQWRPSGYDATQARARDYYMGQARGWGIKALKKRYPLTWAAMPFVDFNFAKLYAEEASSVFDVPWTYHLKPHGDVEILDDEEDFAELIKNADLAAVLPEAERRCKIAKTVWLRVRPDVVAGAALGASPPIEVDIYWPGDVFVLPHPSSPKSVDAFVAVVARAAAEKGTEKFEVWTRTFEGEGDAVRFSPWRVEVITRGDKGISKEVLWEEWPESVGVLPWVPYHDDILDGFPVVNPPSNTLDAVDVINTSMANESMMSDFSSAPILVRKTDAAQPSSIGIGPGTMTDIAREDDLISITQSADFAGVRSVTRAVAGMLALTNRQRVEGLDVDATATALSGIALRIKNEPQEKARRESVNRAKRMVDRLLHVLCLCSDAFAGTSILDGGSPDYEPSEQQDYEDKAAKQTRVLGLLAVGMVDRARALVMLGLARDDADAKEQVEAMSDGRRASGAVAAAITAGMPPAKAVDIDEVEAEQDEVEAMEEKPAAKEDAAPTQDVQATALNGAQTTSLKEVILDVVNGFYPADVARAMIAIAFPGVPVEAVDNLISALRDAPKVSRDSVAVVTEAE